MKNNKNDVVATFSYSNPDREVVMIIKYLGGSQLNDALVNLLKNRECWQDLLKVREHWHEKWIEGLRLAYQDGEEWCLEALTTLQAEIDNKERINALIRKWLHDGTLKL